MDSEIPGAATQLQVASVPDGSEGTESDAPPLRGVPLNIVIHGHKGDGQPARVSLDFASLSDAMAYERVTEERAIAAVVRTALAREHAEALPVASPAAEPLIGPEGRNGSLASRTEDTGPAPKQTGSGGGPALPPPTFMKIREYAARTGYSKRTIENFMDEGLPTVGKGRLRRVDVEPADEWIRNRAAREQDEQDAVEKEAREDARRGSQSRRRRG
jgi:hypothetical protein